LGVFFLLDKEGGVYPFELSGKMPSIFRSLDMELVQIYIQDEAVHETVDKLGEAGLLQFRDLNSESSAFQRPFVNDVRRCEELERVLRFFDKELEKEKIAKDPYMPGEHRMRVDAGLEEELHAIHNEIKDITAGQETLMKNRSELLELRHVLEKAVLFFDNKEEQQTTMEKSSLMEGRSGNGGYGSLNEEPEMVTNAERGQIGRLGHVTGVIEKSKLNSFERVIFRATRGNMLLKSMDITEPLEDPVTQQKKEKVVFAVFYTGEKVMQKVQKIADSFGANRYSLPDSASERTKVEADVTERLNDLAEVIGRGEDRLFGVLENIGHKFNSWQVEIKKEKSIYHTLNRFNYETTTKCLIAEAWCPKDELDAVQEILHEARRASGAEVESILNILPTNARRPTHFKVNKFTQAFQSIVESYGVARYQEYNPAVFTIVTFPFLFAVMFGDVGHGMLMTAFSLFMVIKEDKIRDMFLNNDILQMAFKGRYVLLMMGFFSIYTGSIYNEFLSLPMNMFASMWNAECPDTTCAGPNATQRFYSFYLENITTFDPVEAGWKRDSYYVPAYSYPYGVDPDWYEKSNKLDYYNSLKMKLSIILGVIQMLTGTIAKMTNSFFYRKPVDFFFEALPEFFFMGCLFGYLVVMIFFKWFINWQGRFVFGYINETAATATTTPTYYFTMDDCKADHPTGCFAQQQQPPSLLLTLINMFMKIGNVSPMDALYEQQATVQVVLLIVAVVCVPLLMIPKPMILLAKSKKTHKSLEEETPAGGDDEEEPFSFGEVMVHQLIHTIEYVLGAISNTASYLRLWALSLAHSELAEVFFGRVWMQTVTWSLNGDQTGVVTWKGIIFLFLGTAVFAGATFAVLMLMESLSAVLHALRLHWVEFQNKFYYGDGKKFLPFSYERVLSGEDEN